MGHLKTQSLHIIQLHLGLVLSVDTLVGDQPGGRDSGLGHTITNKENNILGLGGRGRLTDGPASRGGLTIVVGKGGGVVSWLVEGELT